MNKKGISFTIKTIGGPTISGFSPDFLDDKVIVQSIQYPKIAGESFKNKQYRPEKRRVCKICTTIGGRRYTIFRLIISLSKAKLTQNQIGLNQYSLYMLGINTKSIKGTSKNPSFLILSPCLDTEAVLCS
jgi:predicted aspartyl protease